MIRTDTLQTLSSKLTRRHRSAANFRHVWLGQCGAFSLCQHIPTKIKTYTAVLPAVIVLAISYATILKNTRIIVFLPIAIRCLIIVCMCVCVW